MPVARMVLMAHVQIRQTPLKWTIYITIYIVHLTLQIERTDNKETEIEFNAPW